MGSGEGDGFHKPGRILDKGPDLDLGLPIDPDEDFDNSAIYVKALNDNVTLDNLADFFKKCGVVKISKTHRCEDPQTAKASMEWIDVKDFQGSKL